MPIKLTFFALSLLFFQSICQAQEIQKNGLPCVAEICIGDGFTELSKVPFDRAKNPFSIPSKPLYTATRKLSPYDLSVVGKNYRGDLTNATAFLKDQIFDVPALPSLSRVTAYCANEFPRQNQLVGTYTTKNGNPTTVTIQLVPNQIDTSTQKWMVVRITRKFPLAKTIEQRNEVTTQLSERYQAFDPKKASSNNAGEGRFYMLPSYLSFGFELVRLKEANEVDLLMQHPACGGNAKTKID